MDNNTSFLTAVIASTWANNQPFNPDRTPFQFSKASVEEVVKQINERKYNSTPVPVFLHPPKTKIHDVPGVDSHLIMEKKRDPENYLLGQFINAELYHDKEYDVWQCRALINIVNEKAVVGIHNSKNQLCIFTPLEYDPEKSLRNTFQMNAIQIANPKNAVTKILNPPFTVLFSHIGLKRSSSNPYLCIL